MWSLLVAAARWSAICALAILFVFALIPNLLLTAAGAGTLAVAEWSRRKIGELMRSGQ